MTINIGNARDKLSHLIQLVLDGTPVTICRNGKPVVDLVRTKAPDPEPRKYGTMKGKIIINDPDWHKGPQTNEELEAWLDGKM